MIYLDSSVALAHLLEEKRRPPVSFWKNRLCSSRLLEYEVSVTLNRHGLMGDYREAARFLIDRLDIWALSESVLSRALDPLPKPRQIRTLDALHLATCAYIADRIQDTALASYDRRMVQVAQMMGIPIFDLDAVAAD